MNWIRLLAKFGFIGNLLLHLLVLISVFSTQYLFITNLINFVVVGGLVTITLIPLFYYGFCKPKI